MLTRGCRVGRRLILAVVLLALLPTVGLAQQTPSAQGGPAPAEWVAGTGNDWADRQLADIILYAERYPDSFIDEVARYSGARRGYVAGLLQQGWHAGDIYFACFWARASGIDLRTLVRARSAARPQPWQEVLEALESPPTNAQLRTLRHAIVASYGRWDRPITLDAVLRSQLREQGR